MTQEGIEGGSPVEFSVKSDRRFVAEYLEVARSLRLQEPFRIFNPACGADTSLSVAFPQSPIFYVDTDPHVIRALQGANLGPQVQILQGSLMDVHPQDIDLVALRSAIVPGISQQDVVAAVTKNLKSGGIVMASHYAMADTAKALGARKDFQLLGSFSSRDHFDQNDVTRLGKRLRKDKSIPSQFGGVTFVFQKI